MNPDITVLADNDFCKIINDNFFFLGLFLSHLIGSIPFGFLLSKLSGHGDIRKIGSGNIGATNVLRTGNKKLAAFVLFLDAAKGGIAAFALSALLADSSCGENTYTVFALLFGLSAILGHCFPIWLKFKGGKGVATAIGVLLAAVPLAGLAACGIWLLSAFAFRISSLAALIATASAPLVTFFVYGDTPALITLLIAALVFMRHKDNIKRLIKGEEPKIGKKKEKAET